MKKIEFSCQNHDQKTLALMFMKGYTIKTNFNHIFENVANFGLVLHILGSFLGRNLVSIV